MYLCGYIEVMYLCGYTEVTNLCGYVEVVAGADAKTPVVSASPGVEVPGGGDGGAVLTPTGDVRHGLPGQGAHQGRYLTCAETTV